MTATLGWRAPDAGAWLADALAWALEANDRWERLAGELRAECAELRAENARMRERDAQREAKFEQWMSVGDLSYPIGAVLDGSLKVPRDPLNYISERQGLYSRRSITNLSRDCGNPINRGLALCDEPAICEYQVSCVIRQPTAPRAQGELPSFLRTGKEWARSSFST